MSSGEANESTPRGYIAAINAATGAQATYTHSPTHLSTQATTHWLTSAWVVGFTFTFYFWGEKKWPKQSKKEMGRQK